MVAISIAIIPPIGTKILAGFCLGIGFVCKDQAVTHIGNWKRTIEDNLSEGKPWWYNAASEEKRKWRSNPQKYARLVKEQAPSLGLDTDYQFSLS